ncbi:hypothetical protein V1498_09190 [Peribacillus sp. SCS-26]|uniref:hypothetical protein n=1 Tax=Paraperibacillus marinus TaxID=3115295 RepID=UPI003905BF70
MSAVRLPMPAAIQLEKLKAAGAPNDILIHAVKSRCFTYLSDYVNDISAVSFFEDYAGKHQIDCITAIEHGYQFKFLTINGLKNYLIIRFALKENIDFFISDACIDRVKLQRIWLPELKRTVPDLWSIEITDDHPGSENILAKFSGAAMPVAF